MDQYQKSKFLKILLAILLISFFSGNIPNLNNIRPLGLDSENFPSDDSSKIFVLLDTTILGSFFFPVKGKVISHYGKRSGRMHTGTDIKLAHGDTVRAAFSGVVIRSNNYFGYGNLVVLQHLGKLETYYAHLYKSLVKVGDIIQFGTPLGLGGRTGRATTDHLHFEIRKNGKPLNSEHFFDFNESFIKTLVLLKDKKSEKDDREDEIAVVKDPENLPVKKNDLASLKIAKKKYYTIKKGDTLFSLSNKYGTTVDKICKLNGIKKSGVLKVGKKLRIL